MSKESKIQEVRKFKLQFLIIFPLSFSAAKKNQPCEKTFSSQTSNRPERKKILMVSRVPRTVFARTKRKIHFFLFFVGNENKKSTTKRHTCDIKKASHTKGSGRGNLRKPSCPWAFFSFACLRSHNINKKS